MAATFTRRNPRVSCGANGRLEGPTGPIRGVVRDISRGGSFFLANRLLPVGNTVEMRIDLPGVAPIKATGEIRYHHRYKEGDGMGIRFVRLSGEDLEAITQFVHARAGA
jgi:c-di-GMP-binding flagellar brake protein YcgR